MWLLCHHPCLFWIFSLSLVTQSEATRSSFLGHLAAHLSRCPASPTRALWNPESFAMVVVLFTFSCRCLANKTLAEQGEMLGQTRRAGWELTGLSGHIIHEQFPLVMARAFLFALVTAGWEEFLDSFLKIPLSQKEPVRAEIHKNVRQRWVGRAVQEESRHRTGCVCLPQGH